LQKECFLEVSNSFFQDFRNKSEIKSAMKDQQLSRNTVLRREKMSEDFTHQIHNYFFKWGCFLLQLDELRNIRDAAKVILFIHMVFHY